MEGEQRTTAYPVVSLPPTCCICYYIMQGRTAYIPFTRAEATHFFVLKKIRLTRRGQIRQCILSVDESILAAHDHVFL